MKEARHLVALFISIQNFFRRRLAVTGVVLLVSVAFVPSSQANVLSWSGGGGSDAYWNDSANWGFAGTPGNGDTVVFPASQPNLLNTNNIVGLVLNQIRFAGAGGGYDLRGNAFTLTNSILATNTLGANTIENGITLATATNILIIVSNNIILTLDGNLTSSAMVGVNKAGMGGLLYQCSGNNTYLGATLVSAGTLELNASGANAITGPLVIGDGTGAGSPMILDLQSTEMFALPSVTININGTLNLNSFNEATFTTNLVLNGASINTGTGLIGLGPNSTITAGNLSNSYLYGNINNGSGALTIQGNGALAIYATVSGSAGIIQNGPVSTLWYAANTYSGNYIASGSGYVDLLNSQALGNVTNQMTLNGQSYVYVAANVNLTNQSVTINSSANPTLYAYSTSTDSWTANFILNAPFVVDVATNCSLDLNGAISGAGGLTKTDTGTLIYSGATANTFTGPTQVSAGELDLAKNGAAAIAPFEAGLVVGDGTNIANVVYLANHQIYSVVTPVVVNNNATLNLNGFSDTISPLTLSNGVVNTSGGQLGLYNVFANGYVSSISGTVVPQPPALTISTAAFLNIYANIVANSTVGLIKTGALIGGVDLLSSNSYAGPTVIQDGYIRLFTPWSLGGTNSPVVVSNNAGLILWGGIGITNKPLVLNGTDESAVYEALQQGDGGVSIWAGPVTNNANSILSSYATTSELHINGPISGVGGLELSGFTGEGGTVFFEGAASNSYAGQTIIDTYNTLQLNNSGNNYGAVPGNVVVNGILRLANNEQINPAADVLVNAGGLFDFGAFFQDVNTLHGSGNITFGVGGYLNIGLLGGSSEFDGLMSGTGYPGGYTVGKYGAGTFIMTGNNSYFNGNNVYGGSLIINGYQPQNPVMVYSGGTLGGSGTVGPISANGIVAPGNNPGLGILTSSNATFSSTGGFKVEIAGLNPGTGYDQLNVTGMVSLASAKLLLNMPVAGATNTQLTIINNQGASAVAGTFSGLPEGATVTADNGAQFKITYQGGTGKSVVLTQITLPTQPKFTGITKIGGGSEYLSGTGYTNLAYTVEANTNLATATWINIGTAIANGSGRLQFTDPTATNYPVRFYRFSFP